MLSPGTWYKQVPKDLKQNLEWRQFVFNSCQNNPDLQKAFIGICKQDILFFVNTFVWQYNPMDKGALKAGPFITWPYQERALLDTPETTGNKGLLWCYENDKTGVVEKSRDMGASWLFLIFEDWLCRKFGYAQILNVSRNADAVDASSRNSLFQKLVFIHDHFPDWLKGRIKKTSMTFSYQDTKSEITGEASTGFAGVGGRGSVVFIDEFTKIKEAQEVRQGTASTANCRFFNATHEGPNTEFCKLTSTPEIIKIQMHWTRHPLKNKGLYSYDREEMKERYWRYNEETDELDETVCLYDYGPDFRPVRDGTPVGGPHPGIRSPWYDNKVIELGSAASAASELDINPTGSVAQLFDPLVIRGLIEKYCRKPIWEGDIVYSERGQVVEFIEADGGPFRLWTTLDREGNALLAPYGCGIDVSGGNGVTPSCMTITNGITGEKVLEYFNSRIKPVDFGTLAVAICRRFKDRYGTPARMMWEHHGPGATFGAQVIDLHYENIGENRTDTVGNLARRQSKTIGFNPGGPRMGLLLRDYANALVKGKMLNPSERALAETLSWKYDDSGRPTHPSKKLKGSPEGAGENHGDLTVSDALSWKMVKDYGELSATEAEQRAKELAEPKMGSFEWRQLLGAEEEKVAMRDTMEGL